MFAGSTEVFHAGEGNAILGPVMGEHSVLLLDEAEHLRIRRLLMPAFHGASLRGYREPDQPDQPRTRSPAGRPACRSAATTGCTR